MTTAVQSLGKDARTIYNSIVKSIKWAQEEGPKTRSAMFSIVSFIPKDAEAAERYAIQSQRCLDENLCLTEAWNYELYKQLFELGQQLGQQLAKGDGRSSSLTLEEGVKVLSSTASGDGVLDSEGMQILAFKIDTWRKHFEKDKPASLKELAGSYLFVLDPSKP